MWTDRLKEKKDRLVLPISSLLDRLGIKPLHLTAIGVVFGLLGVNFLFRNNTLFIIFSILWMVSDVLDGALARHANKINWWQDYLTDRMVFVLLLSKSILFLETRMVEIALAGYIVVHLANFAKRQKYVLLYPEFPAFLLYFAKQYHAAVWFIFVSGAVDMAVIILFARIRGLKRLLLKH